MIALAHHYLDRFARETGRELKGFTEAALALLRNYTWPGNVRELCNVIERAVLLADGPRVRAEDVALVGPAPAAPTRPWAPVLPPDGVVLSEVERELVQQALERSGFVQKEAALLLGISRRKLNYMIGRMGITHPSWRRHRAPREGGPTDRALPLDSGARSTES